MKYDWLDEIDEDVGTSEEHYKIVCQPSDTCPMIDYVITLTTSTDALGKLEEIRRHCKEIRQWGFEWKILAKQLIENYPTKSTNGN